ncbi:FadR/GntR family transcriptional regulator [Paenibacillus filicis]|uniref:FadR/GntR family transcriptional regulator n=1 Tax=Paenibacillus gyeongsangnamensis TaxID=3388067 RepID=A0ABT4QHH2_9BACL|nr:FadR/GntR family transcriptional regulator [Paenibacillus filicis]MCZ8516302.1 FadR/GntR family transcriptional regulator [Paenibacillus filicis]
MVFQNIKKPDKLYVRIAEQINSFIVDGTFKSGDKLPPEREIAERFGVSRPSVREALAVLEIMGVIDIRVGDGTYIKKKTSNFNLEVDSLKDSSTFELIEARQLIESLIIELAIDRATEEQIAILQETAIIMRNCIDTNMNEFYEQGVRFHKELAIATNNEVFAKISENLVHPVANPLYWLLHQKALNSKDARMHQILEHEEIIEAIKTKDKDRAKKALEHHLCHIEELLLFEKD